MAVATFAVHFDVDRPQSVPLSHTNVSLLFYIASTGTDQACPSYLTSHTII